jgi:hypothetical protein
MNQLLYPTAQAAALLSVKPQTLRVWRWNGTGPKYIRYGKSQGRVMYRREDLEAWLDGCTHASTSEETVNNAASVGSAADSKNK